MKKLFYLLIAVLFTFSLNAQTIPVPNGDFEFWNPVAYDNPTNWDSPNISLASIPFNSTWVVTKEIANPYAGTYSAKLECKNVNIITSTMVVPGFLTLGDLAVNTSTSEVSITGGIPFTDRPDKLTGFYKFLPTGSDMAMFEIVLLNYDPGTMTVIDTIGSGYFFPSVATTGWESFEAEIDYTSNATPNFLNVNILCSTNSVVGSTLFVDDLELYTEPQIQHDLFFSEYIEGSSNNKAIEIFNGTGSTVDLSNYTIKMSRNGSGWGMYDATTAEPNFIYNLSGTLADGDVYVMSADQATAAVLAVADTAFAYPSICHYSGDDALGLFKNDTLIDVFGTPDVDPGTGWNVAGVTNATVNYTLVRKESVEYGNTDWASSAGTDSTNSEWIVYPIDEFSYLGTHNQPVNSAENEILTLTLTEQYSPADIDNSDFTVDIIVVAGTNVTALVPTITVSAGATILPASGVVQDFTNPVNYTVTSQTGVDQIWVVTVTEYVIVETDLFFSEYIEGSGNNKALEIYNPTATTKLLADYQIGQAVNGGGWAYYHIFPAGAYLDPGEVWVIVADQVDVTLYNPANADEVLAYPSVVHHNGDDARALLKISGNDTTMLDLIGDPNNDPGDGWDVAGIPVATKDHTLVRKPDITEGNTSWVLSAGTNTTDSEWIVLDMNDFSNLGIHNTGNNIPPVISNVTILPALVTNTDDVTIAATINDTDGSVTSVTFDWGTDGINFPNSITLTSLFDAYSTYPDVIPAQPSGTTVYFRFIATDNSNATTTLISNYTVASPPVTATIYEIQGQLDVSPFEGQNVITSGIVTGLLPGSSQGYFVQDGTGAWNGVFVYDNVNLPAVGDEITFTALVSEYYELTELKEVTDFTIVSSGNTLPEPVVLSTLDVNSEDYEGVFVRVEAANCLTDDYGFGMWQIDDGSGPILVHNNGSYTYTPSIGVSYNVQGVLNYTFSEWKIELRMAEDVELYEGISDLENSNISIYPNPVSSVLNITSTSLVSQIKMSNILGENVLLINNNSSENIAVDMTGFVPGIYIINIVNADGTSRGMKVVKE